MTTPVVPTGLQAPYATVAQYRSQVNKIDDASDDDIVLDLLAVSRYIDKKTGRFFNHDEDPVTRTYLCRGDTTLWIDDVCEPPLVEIVSGSDLVEVTAYRLWPAGADLKPEPEPWQALLLSSPQLGVEYSVTARRGWSAVPYPVNRGTIEITAIWRLESPRATSRVNELDEVIGTSPLANKLVYSLVHQFSRKKWVFA
jgi:hypothetical protein